MGMIAWPLVLLALSQAPATDAPPVAWRDGEHLTGDWHAERTRLADHGITLEVLYSAEAFLTTARLGTGDQSAVWLGHIDASLALDTAKLGLWPGGHFYFLGQNNHGEGINNLVGSATAISNYEARPLTQLTEFFYEQSLLSNMVRIRLGKQDANREFGTPRYGGNFINNNFGMYPTGPLPSYPTTGLGATLVVEPTAWLAAKLCVFEGNPLIESLGFDSAFGTGGGLTTALGVALTHRFGKDHRHGGTTSLGAWVQTGAIAELGDVPLPRTFSTNWGAMVQNDERIYSDPSNVENNGGLNLITRFAWSQPDRNDIPLYVGASLAWHGLTSRRENDTVGVGFGYFTVTDQRGGTPGPGSELFVEAFYKLRLTHFFSVQPDAQLYLHPGGDGRTTLLLGGRVKVKL